jgi:hypothetical protein
MEDKLFTLLGLGVPFYLAAATYAVFSWLDNNASDEATKVISSWLHGRSQNKPDLGNLIISAFDRIYTSPLLTFRAFRRSAAISSIIYLLVCLVPLAWTFYLSYRSGWWDQYWRIYRDQQPEELRDINGPAVIGFQLGIAATIVIIIDFISLFFVRKFLVLARVYPISASIISSTFGLGLVIIGWIIIITVSISRLYWLDPAVLRFIYPFPTWKEVVSNIDVVRMVLPNLFTSFFEITRSAFVVHLWLPLFALSSLVVRLVYLILRAVEWAQWFLKQGDAHPLKAIGVVATIIVFGSAVLVKEAWTVL